MGRPEIWRSGEVSLGDNPAGNEVDDKEQQSTDTIGPVPEENQEGNQGRDDDPDKPVEKFAERFPAGEADADDDESDDDESEDDESRSD